MRVIKFRAWDKAGRKMLYGWNLACDDKGVFETGWFGGLDGLDPETEDDLWDEYNHTTIELMQFTGRKDKNKKDIYRCDILRGKNGLWEVKWIDDNICGWNIRVEDTDMEIIGNRHENPGLL